MLKFNVLIHYRDSIMDLDEKFAIHHSGFADDSRGFGFQSACSDSLFALFRGYGYSTGVDPAVIVPRYTTEPFWQDYLNDLNEMGFYPINTARMYNFCRDLKEWYAVLGPQYTPRTWSIHDMHKIQEKNRAFVVKGSVNSRKSDWEQSMFAHNFEEAVMLTTELQHDGLLGQQDLYVREYEHFLTYLRGPGGIPVIKEFRIHAAFGEILDIGFYWRPYMDQIANSSNYFEGDFDGWTAIPVDWRLEVVRKLSEHCNFFAVDVAELADGSGWRVVEVNAGEMAGLCSKTPEHFYKPLYELIRQKGEVCITDSW